MSKLKNHFGSGPLSFILAILLALIILKIELILNIKKIALNLNVLVYILLIMGLLLMLYSVISLPIKKRSKHLITHGPYKYIRHPIYSAGIFLLYPALALFLKSWLVLISTILVYILFKIAVKSEEKHLLTIFGEEYKKYSEKTPQFIPRKPNF